MCRQSIDNTNNHNANLYNSYTNSCISCVAFCEGSYQASFSSSLAIDERDVFERKGPNFEGKAKETTQDSQPVD